MVREGTSMPRRASRMPLLVTVSSSLAPGLYPLLFAEQRAPGLAVAVGAVRADPLKDLADQLVAQLLLAAAALDPELEAAAM